MKKIRILESDVINKIAAGEVVEDPSSVVKELVENSLDAGSDEIYIEILDGGRELIRVSDNGCGMGPDDVFLALERHATSKLRAIEDLDLLHTMGFRGEALPSIAAISKLTIITSEDSKGGTFLVSEGGKIVKNQETVRDPGTTIDVRSLFYNLPVRRKFQRSPKFDRDEIVKIVTQVALSHPRVGFRLVSDNKMIFSVNPSKSLSLQSTISERVGSLFGEEFLDTVLPISEENETFKCIGFIGDPTQHKPNRSGQFLFLNSRPIISPLISGAVQEGYGSSLPTQRYPSFILHVHLPGDWVDVNVHPQKREVRFREEKVLKGSIVNAVMRTIQGVQAYPKEIAIFSPKVCEKIQNQPSTKLQFIPEEEEKEDSKKTALLMEMEVLQPYVLATIPGYILIEEGEGGIRIVDQRRGHQRVLFEELLNRQKPSSTSKEVQTLLIPHLLEVTGPESCVLREYLPHFNLLGIGIRELGIRTFAIDSVPSYFEDKDIKEMMLHILEDLRKNNKMDQTDVFFRIALHSVRFSSISKNKMSLQEAEALVKKLMQCENPKFCPFGKQIFVTMDKKEIEQRFN